MKDFFSENDCDERHLYSEPDKPLRWVKAISLEHANRLIRERSTVVMCDKDASPNLWFCNGIRGTHRGVILCVEPIEKPDSAEQIVRDLSQLGIQGLLGAQMGGELINRARALLAKESK